MNDVARDALGYQQITNLAAAVPIPAIVKGTETVLLQPETQNVRYRDDGTDPTAAVGMLLVVNTIYEFTVAQLASMKFIEAAASAKLNISAYGSRA